MKTRKLMPKTMNLVGWIDYDLRCLRSNAITLARKNKLRPGDTLLVSGALYKGTRRCMFLLQTVGGPMVVTTQTENEEQLLAFLLQVHNVADLYFEPRRIG